MAPIDKMASHTTFQLHCAKAITELNLRLILGPPLRGAVHPSGGGAGQRHEPQLPVILAITLWCAVLLSYNAL